jgi:transposase
MTMAKPLLDDVLWNRIQALLPAPKPRRLRYPGRKPIDDRKALTGILFVLKMGIPWEELPQEMGCGSGMTCWRRLQHWHQASAWQNIQKVLMTELREANRIDWSRAARDGVVRLPVESEANGDQTYRNLDRQTAASGLQETSVSSASPFAFPEERLVGYGEALPGGFQEALVGSH